jgi:hypothetical protein
MYLSKEMFLITWRRKIVPRIKQQSISVLFIDVYSQRCEKFKQAWHNKIEREIELDELEQELENDAIHIDYDLHDVCQTLRIKVFLKYR